MLDRTHLRWFTRQTLIELFESQGFKIVAGLPRIGSEPQRDLFLPLIAEIAKKCGLDPQVAVNDSTPVQYVIKAIPV